MRKENALVVVVELEMTYQVARRLFGPDVLIISGSRASAAQMAGRRFSLMLRTFPAPAHPEPCSWEGALKMRMTPSCRVVVDDIAALTGVLAKVRAEEPWILEGASS